MKWCVCGREIRQHNGVTHEQCFVCRARPVLNCAVTRRPGAHRCSQCNRQIHKRNGEMKNPCFYCRRSATQKTRGAASKRCKCGRSIRARKESKIVRKPGLCAACSRAAGRNCVRCSNPIRRRGGTRGAVFAKCDDHPNPRCTKRTKKRVALTRSRRGGATFNDLHDWCRQYVRDCISEARATMRRE